MHFAMQQAKFRAVCDGSAFFEGRSLNKKTLMGPDNLQPLFNVLTRFGMGKVAATADLKECFFQIGILPEQRDLFRIL